MSILAYLLARLKEPSTYAGIAGLLAAAGIHVSIPILQAAIQVLVSVAGLGAMLIPENKA